MMPAETGGVVIESLALAAPGRPMLDDLPIFVGVLYVPLALPALGLPHVHGLMVAALAIGLFFAIQIFALIFSRLLLGPPLPAALRPSLLILVSPFAVGYSTYAVTAGGTDLSLKHSSC
jgi:tellurite resistance protein TehA-like permease